MACTQVQRIEVDVRLAASADNQSVFLLFRKQQRSGDMVTVAGTSDGDDIAAVTAHGAFGGVEGPGKHRFGRRGIQRLAVTRKGNAVRKVGILHKICCLGHTHTPTLILILNAQSGDSDLLLDNEESAIRVEDNPAWFGQIDSNELGGVSRRKRGRGITWLQCVRAVARRPCKANLGKCRYDVGDKKGTFVEKHAADYAKALGRPETLNNAHV